MNRLSQSNPGRTGSRRRRGFFLIEMLVIMGLLTVAGLLAARLYYTTGQALQRAEQRQTAQAQFDQALARLRADVWQAASVGLKDPHTLLIHEAQNQTITWSSSASLQRRTDGAHRQVDQWTQLGTTLELDVRGPQVIVIDHSADPPGRIVLLGQTMLLTGSNR
ncbi:MAG TPA: hypothetical protein VN541_22155 [Tepidisphaeraceae bacterium]|nr:hypothetical protein [Tepidisphaeraceae bacterium]